MRRSHVWDKMMMRKKKIKDDDDEDKAEKRKSSRILITINVFGSAGAIRFVVNGDEDSAAAVIERALKMYARAGRLPVLGSDINSISLYPANDGFDALKASEAIGSRGVRNFVMSKNERSIKGSAAETTQPKGSGGRWRAWLQKSLPLGLKILSLH